jgi:hypothetical protein
MVWRRWGLVPLYLLPAVYLVTLGVRGVPLYDPNPALKLFLRLLIMDILPVLWVLPFFQDELDRRYFLKNLIAKGMRKPLCLAAPAVAVVLFFHQSILTLLHPASAGPTPLGAVLWMQASAAMMTVLVMSLGVKGDLKGPSNRKSVIGFFMMTGAGLVTFFATGCDISRLLILVGFSSVALQWGLDSCLRVTRIKW